MLPPRGDFKLHTTSPVVFRNAKSFHKMEIQNVVVFKKRSLWRRLKCWFWLRRIKRSGEYDRLMKKIRQAQEQIMNEVMYRALCKSNFYGGWR